MARELNGISELGSITNSGWATLLPNFTFATNPRTDINGNGGVYDIEGTGSSHFRSPVFASGRELKHFFVKLGVNIGNAGSSSTGSLQIQFEDASANLLMFIRFADGLGDSTITIRRGSTILATAAQPLGLNMWRLIEIEVFLDNINGFVKVWVDQGNKSGTPWVEASGDTTEPGGGLARISIKNLNANKIDDLSINSITMSVDGVSGTFQAGETITGGTSGATAVITAVEISVGAGVLVLQEWNGTAFQDNETITGGTSGATGLVNAPTSDYKNGFEPNSGHIGNEFLVLMRPNANGNSSQLIGSDGDSIDNYLLVNDVPTDSIDYVETTTAGSRDTYKIDASTVLPPASQVSKITMVQVHSFAFSDLIGINNASLILRQGTTDYESPNKALPSSPNMLTHIYNIQPNGSGAWTHAALTNASLEVGILMKS